MRFRFGQTSTFSKLPCQRQKNCRKPPQTKYQRRFHSCGVFSGRAGAGRLVPVLPRPPPPSTAGHGRSGRPRFPGPWPESGSCCLFPGSAASGLIRPRGKWRSGSGRSQGSACRPAVAGSRLPESDPAGRPRCRLLLRWGAVPAAGKETVLWALLALSRHFQHVRPPSSRLLPEAPDARAVARRPSLPRLVRRRPRECSSVSSLRPRVSEPRVGGTGSRDPGSARSLPPSVGEQPDAAPSCPRSAEQPSIPADRRADPRGRPSHGLRGAGAFLPRNPSSQTPSSTLQIAEDE